MITGKFWNIHDDDTLRQIAVAAVRLLTETGCRIEHEELLNLLSSAGCRVDTGTMRCYFSEELIQEALTHLGGPCDESVEIPTGWNPQHQLYHLGNYPHMLEWPSGQRRLATRQDVIDMAKLAHRLPEFDYVGQVLVCSELDQRIEPLWNVLQRAQITDKTIGGGDCSYAGCIGPLVSMGEVLNDNPNDTSLIPECDFFTSPLAFDPQQAECFLAKRRLGIRNVPGTMPVSGISTPVTIAGPVTVAVAELIAGWVFGYVVDPDIPAGGLVGTASFDMRTMTACFSSPEAMLQDITTVHVCRRLFGISVGACTGYVDCKRPGLEAVFHKMFSVMGAPFGTSRTVVSCGLLAAGQDYSPIQHLLDAELNEALERFWGSFEVNEETIAIELIEQIAKDGRTDFLNTKHTLEHFKAEQWYPRWLDRSLWQGQAVEVEAEQKMLERISQYCTDAIADYERPDIDEAKIEELRRIFIAAERQIVGKNVAPV